MRRLALFDLDNTLIQRDRAFAAWAQEFAAAHGLGEGAVAWLISADRRHKGPMGPYFDAVRAEFGLSEPGDELWWQYRRRMPDLAECRPADRVALASLRRRGWRIGIVTNGAIDNQLGKIHNAGLAELVDGWCVSQEIGIRKPGPEIFRLAAERCGASLDGGGWMVGDDLRLDIAGGSGVGLRTIWIPEPRLAERAATLNRRFFAGPVPDFTAGTAAEAIEIILANG